MAQNVPHKFKMADGRHLEKIINRYISYGVSTQRFAFGRCVDIASYLGGQILQTLIRAWIGVFKSNAQNIQIFVLGLSKQLQR